LVLQSTQDPVVDPRGSRKIFEKIGTEDKEYVLFNFNRHGILLGDGSEKVYRVIGDFLQRF
jgi:esterase/lipase